MLTNTYPSFMPTKRQLKNVVKAFFWSFRSPFGMDIR